jgi:RNA polymerase subunit RPABC4/transcription elongation factor Spt4
MEKPYIRHCFYSRHHLAFIYLLDIQGCKAQECKSYILDYSGSSASFSGFAYLSEDIVERDLEIRRMEMLLAANAHRCPTCGKEIKDDFVICPNCRKKLKKTCMQCEKPLSLEWKVCPYCKSEQ